MLVEKNIIEKKVEKKIVETKAKIKKRNRKEEILQTLVIELEKNPGERITTANLAKAVGVSEAALYRHFPSKAKMFEALIEYSEDSVFGIINKITNEKIEALTKVEKIIMLLLGFSSKNPGITRILSGDALVGENERLMRRCDQFFQRLETQLKQVLREGELNGQVKYQGNISKFAVILSSFVEGKFNQYVRTRFSKKPDDNWSAKWSFFIHGIT